MAVAKAKKRFLSAIIVSAINLQNTLQAKSLRSTLTWMLSCECNYGPCLSYDI